MNTEATETPIETIELTTKTMLGEIMACTLDTLKQAPDVWQKLTQEQQDVIIQRVDARAREVVTAAVHAIANRGFVHVPATLEQFVAKDGYKAVVLPSAFGDDLYRLVSAVGTTITLVLARPEDFVSGGHKHRAEPNQRALDLEAEAVDAEGEPSGVEQIHSPDEAEPEQAATPITKSRKRDKAEA